MFDGNFRSRKEVNYSSGSTNSSHRRRPRGSVGKAALLQHAQAQREERQAKQRRDRAARVVQRWMRAWWTRQQLLREWKDSQQLAAIAIRLQFLPEASRKDYLVQVAQSLSEIKTTESLEKEDSMEISQHGGDDSAASSSSSSSWYSERRLVVQTLRTLVPSNVAIESERETLISIFNKYWKPTRLRLDEPLFLELIASLNTWWEGAPNHYWTEHLAQWSIPAAHTFDHCYAKALLATILLRGSPQGIVPRSRVYEGWLAPLNRAILEAPWKSGTSSALLLLNAIPIYLQRADKQILSHLLTIPSLLQDPKALLPLLSFLLLLDTRHSDLAWCMAWLVRGESLEQGSTTADSSSSKRRQEWGDESDQEDDDDDDDSEEEMEATPPRGSSTHGRQPSSSSSSYSKYSRKEILTIAKLDRLYWDRVRQQVTFLTSPTTINPATKILATQLVQTIPWLQWGLALLGGESPDGLDQRYIALLGLVLRATTGLRPHAKVGILSPLALSREFVCKLWVYAAGETDASETALCVFCDLFAHYMVALSDVDFVRFHHYGINSSGEGDMKAVNFRGVSTVAVIEHLRVVLFDVYWNKPVVEAEVKPDEIRGRLLLAGTKVWNSLYERWNRLIRVTPFCDESTWWFPHMSTKDGASAVVPARERPQESGRSSDDGDDDAMDIDEDHTSSTSSETDALAHAFRDPKMARVLTAIPQALPFDRRVKLFQSLLRADKHKTIEAASTRRTLMSMGRQDLEEELFNFMDGSVRERVRIRRAQLYDDSMKLLNELGPRLKHQVQVSFVNQHGAEEAGIDGGGVFKEFLDDLIKDGFAAKTGQSDAGAPPLFTVTPLQTLAVNMDLVDDPNMLVHYEFLGRVLGKAVYESILVEPQFCLPFLNQLLAKVNTMEDMKNFDEEYYKNLSMLRNMSEEDIDSMGLTFELTIGSTSRARTIELFPGGRKIPVTRKNVFQYMHMVAYQLLNVQGARQTRAFLRGFRDLIPASWVRLFSAIELQKLISGDDSVRGIDVPSLKRAMTYLGGYHPSQPYIEDFWDILEHDLTPEQQRKFLRFMTSCSRQPLLGFGSLEPMPSIQQIRLRDEELSKNSKLPTSQTCMNLLKLPNYKNRTLLKEKLIAAIESGAGFELT